MRFCEHCGSFYEELDVEFCPDDGHRLTALARPEDPMEKLVGTVIDNRFRVARLLGSGGMGAVFEATQTSVERPVALKIILDGANGQLAKRFMLEARATSKLRNVHTVTIYDFGQAADGMLYLAMEHIEGRGLDEVLEEAGPMPWPEALHIVNQVAESLAEAHNKRIVHRDIKPGNIMLTRMGSDSRFVKVLDFGIAKLQSGTTTSLTGTGNIIGTPLYMSPEQARGERVDPRSDLYSLGVVLYRLLVGVEPFVSDTPMGLLIMHCQDPVLLPSQRVPELGIPMGVERLLGDLLEKDPDRRIQTATELQSRIRELVATNGASPRPVDDAMAVAPTGPWPVHQDKTTEEPALVSTVPGKTTEEPEPVSTVPGKAVELSTAVEQRGRPSSRRWLVVAVALLLIGGGAIAVLSGGGPPEPPAPAALAAQPAVGEQPPAADLAASDEPSIDAEPDPDVSEAPDAVERLAFDGGEPEPSPEPVELVIPSELSTDARGEESQPPDGVEMLALDIREPGPILGPVEIRSTPPGARVYRREDSAFLGHTPLSIDRSDLPMSIRLRKKGYRSAPKLVESDRQEPIRIKMKPVEKGFVDP